MVKAFITSGIVFILAIAVGEVAMAQQSSSKTQTVTFGVHRIVLNSSGNLALAPVVSASESGVVITPTNSSTDQNRKFTVGSSSSSNHSVAPVSPLQMRGYTSTHTSLDSPASSQDIHTTSFLPNRQSSKSDPLVITITE